MAARKLVLLAVLGGIVYALASYWSVAQTYFTLRYSAQKLANLTLIDGRRSKHLTEVLEEARRDTGLKLQGHNFHLTTEGREVRVVVTADVPVPYPFLDEPGVQRVTVTARARQKGTSE